MQTGSEFNGIPTPVENCNLTNPVGYERDYVPIDINTLNSEGDFISLYSVVKLPG